MKVDLLITNGCIVTGAGRLSADIAVKGGKVVAITTEKLPFEAAQTINAGGKFILPGLVDSEAHPGCYVPFERDIKSESRAAAAAGVTTWGVHAPVTRLGAEPFVEFVQPQDVGPFSKVMPFAKAIIDRSSAVDIWITPMLETDEQVAEIPQLAQEWGITSYKLYLQSMKPELDKFWAGRKAGLGHGFDDGVVFQTMEQVAKLGGTAITQIHAENWQLGRVFEKRLIEAGRTDFGAWTDRSPYFAEVHHVRSYGYLAKITGSPLYIQHASTRQTHEEIRRLRGEGVKVYGQTGPVWLYLEPNAKAWRINVPVRYREDIEAIWEALADGTVDAVGSDHVISWDPNHRDDMHNPNIWKLRTGFTSRVEMLLPVVLGEGVNKGRITLERAVEILCENPAKIFGMYPKKGTIAVGADADFCIIDLDRERVVTDASVVSRSKWSVVAGDTFKGWPVMTILRGKVISEWPDDAEKPWVIEDATHGQYLARQAGQTLYQAS
jgi:dihydropyrimidinase/dihydroorotase